MKRVPARRKTEPTLDNDDDPQSASEELAGVSLYAADQTTFYRPPPVVNGRIPKNVYGNLDIYVPSMVPPGGSHIIHPETVRAARVLGIDYAQAVTGFEFKGRHGTAVISGAVVASEYCQAVKEVIEGFDDDRAQEEQVRRSVEALRAWKRLLTGLRIRQRIDGYEIEGERKFAGEGTCGINEEEEHDDDEYDDDEGGGGFVPHRALGASAEPTVRTIDRSRGDGELWGGFVAEVSLEDGAGGFGYTNDQSRREFAAEKDLEDYDRDAGGGFMIDDVSDENNDRNQGIRPAVDPFGTSRIKDQPDNVHVDQFVEGAQPRQNRPSGVRELVTSSLPVEGNLPDEYAEQLTPRNEYSTLTGGNGSGRDGDCFMPEEDGFPIQATAAVEEHESTAAERKTSINLLTPQPHNEEDASDQPSAGATAVSNPTKSRIDQRSQKASTPSPSANAPPPHSRNIDDSMTPSQPAAAVVGMQDYANVTGTTDGGGLSPSSDDSDAGSLLSQDPEDEDADPEGLA